MNAGGSLAARSRRSLHSAHDAAFHTVTHVHHGAPAQPVGDVRLVRKCKAWRRLPCIRLSGAVLLDLRSIQAVRLLEPVDVLCQRRAALELCVLEASICRQPHQIVV